MTCVPCQATVDEPPCGPHLYRARAALTGEERGTQQKLIHFNTISTYFNTFSNHFNIFHIHFMIFLATKTKLIFMIFHVIN